MVNREHTSLIKKAFNDASIVVIKVGSDFVANKDTGKANVNLISGLAADISDLQKQGKHCIVVASGLVKLGRVDAGFSLTEELTIEQKQDAAVWGMPHHSLAFYEGFKKRGLRASPTILVEPHHLEWHDKGERALKQRIQSVWQRGATPILNENDPIVDRELRYGNNDVLAADVANLMNADLTVLLTDQDGLYTGDPDEDDTATHIDIVQELTPEIIAMAKDSSNRDSCGGMNTKIKAIKKLFDHYRTGLIARGVGFDDNLHYPRPISKLIHSEETATVFMPMPKAV